MAFPLDTRSPAVRDFDDFLSRQRARLKARLNACADRMHRRQEALEAFDVEVRKQPGTNFCITTGSVTRPRDTDGGRI